MNGDCIDRCGIARWRPKQQKGNPMPSFRLPLSGDVSQAINPWAWFFRTVGNQLGLINVNLGKSSDPATLAPTIKPLGGNSLPFLVHHRTVIISRVAANRSSPGQADAQGLMFTE
jgi:hypothetical protein